MAFTEEDEVTATEEVIMTQNPIYHHFIHPLIVDAYYNLTQISLHIMLQHANTKILLCKCRHTIANDSFLLPGRTRTKRS